MDELKRLPYGLTDVREAAYLLGRAQKEEFCLFLGLALKNSNLKDILLTRR